MSERLEPAKTCLLLFDFLVGHVARDAKRYAPVLANAARILACARERGAMVAYARADHRPGSHAQTAYDAGARPPLIMHGTPEAAIVPELAPRATWTTTWSSSLTPALRRSTPCMSS